MVHEKVLFTQEYILIVILVNSNHFDTEYWSNLAEIHSWKNKNRKKNLRNCNKEQIIFFVNKFHNFFLHVWLFKNVFIHASWKKIMSLI